MDCIKKKRQRWEEFYKEWSILIFLGVFSDDGSKSTRSTIVESSYVQKTDSEFCLLDLQKHIHSSTLYFFS